MSFQDFIFQSGRQCFRLGLIEGRATVSNSPHGISIKPTHPEPFGYGKDEMNASNWFGVSVYRPDRIIQMPNGTFLKMSLQGMTAPYDERFDTLFEQRAVKYMLIQREDVKLWETWSGEIPPAEVLEAAMV